MMEKVKYQERVSAGSVLFFWLRYSLRLLNRDELDLRSIGYNYLLFYLPPYFYTWFSIRSFLSYLPLLKNTFFDLFLVLALL
jgi:hypothetical protein